MRQLKTVKTVAYGWKLSRAFLTVKTSAESCRQLLTLADICRQLQTNSDSCRLVCSCLTFLKGGAETMDCLSGKGHDKKLPPCHGITIVPTETSVDPLNNLWAPLNFLRGPLNLPDFQNVLLLPESTKMHKGPTKSVGKRVKPPRGARIWLL